MRLTRRGKIAAAVALVALVAALLSLAGPSHPCDDATSVMLECWQPLPPVDQ